MQCNPTERGKRLRAIARSLTLDRIYSGLSEWRSWRSIRITLHYREGHLVADLVWLEMVLTVLPPCTAAMPILHHDSDLQPQNLDDKGTTKNKVNPTPVHDQMPHPVQRDA